MTKKDAENLLQKIALIKEQEENRVKPSAKERMDGVGSVGGIAIEIVSAISAGSVLGLFLDKIFASKPILFIICLIFAAMAAFRLIWKKYL
jgi:F0F1-type ATP synthase assembly protein I